MLALKSPARSTSVTLSEARIAIVFDDGGCLLDTGLRVQRALSCLIEPKPGDRVLFAHGGNGLGHLLHVLEREPGQQAELSVPGAVLLAVRQPQIAIHAGERLDLGSAGSASLAAVQTLSLTGGNLFASVRESLVAQAEHYVGRFGQYLVDARALLRLHGKDALVTAERDVKVDAERISMG